MAIKTTLSLVTFNTLGTPFLAQKVLRRHKKIAEMINASTYDIVCLDEIFTYADLLLFKHIVTAFPFVTYKKNLLGPKGGLVIFSKMPVTDSEFIPFSFPKNATIPPHTRLVTNGILLCTLKDKPLTIAATHLTSDILTHDVTPQEKLYPLIRSQLLEAAGVMNRRSFEKNAVLLAGDFNIAAQSTLYQEFLTKTKAVDLFKKVPTPTYFFKRLNYLFPTPVDNRIDFIFLKQNQRKFAVTSLNHVFDKEELLSDRSMSYLSDHSGLQISFSLD